MKESSFLRLDPESIRASYVRRMEDLLAQHEKAFDACDRNPQDRRSAAKMRKLDREIAKIVAEVHRLSRLIEARRVEKSLMAEMRQIAKECF